MTRGKFWIDDLSYLFSSSSLIPNTTMSNEEKFNALSRLVLFIAFGLYLIAPFFLIPFLISAIITLSLIYFLTKFYNG